jgi:ATP-dependent RNA helicase DDX56/DBP9
MADARLVDPKATFTTFANLLDARLLRALADMGFARPTLVQSKAIPLALESRDILARARTGSGKTAAYCIPIAQKILSSKAVCMFAFHDKTSVPDEETVTVSGC